MDSRPRHQARERRLAGQLGGPGRAPRRLRRYPREGDVARQAEREGARRARHGSVRAVGYVVGSEVTGHDRCDVAWMCWWRCNGVM